MTGPYTVRTYHDTDHDALVRLWRSVFPDDPPRNNPADVIRRKQAVDPDGILVATSDDHLVGAVICAYDGFRGWIYHLAVEPTHRNRAVGRQLVTACEQRLTKLGCPKVNLQVRDTNTDVIAFYNKLGYDTEPRASLGKSL